MSITLANLKTQARYRANMENSLFVTDAELLTYINSSIAELHDLLVASFDSDYSISSYEFSTVSGTDSYALPSAFYKLKGVDAQLNGTYWSTISPFNFNERNLRTGVYSSNLLGYQFKYRILGGNLVFSPVPDGAYNIKMWYIPTATKLVNDADTLDDINQYSEYIIVDAAIKMLQKEESDVSILLAQKADLRKRIENMAQNRDADKSDAVSDIYLENSEEY